MVGQDLGMSKNMRNQLPSSSGASKYWNSKRLLEELKRGKKPAKRTNEMDPSIPSCFLKIVFMDQTVHLMVIVYVVSQLSLSVTNITAALLGVSAALEFWHDGEMMKKNRGLNH